MIVLHSPLHQRHAPAHEFFRGERVPCFETRQRAEFVLEGGYAAAELGTNAANVIEGFEQQGAMA